MKFPFAIVSPVGLMNKCYHELCSTQDLWLSYGLMTTLNPLASSVTVLKLMSVQFHFNTARLKWTFFKTFVCFLFFPFVFFSFFPLWFDFFSLGECVCMICCGWLTGFDGPGEAITHLNKNRWGSFWSSLSFSKWLITLKSVHNPSTKTVIVL